MQTQRLGNSDLDITPIGFGAWAIGGPGWAFTWGPQEDRDSIAAIHEAVDLGINWIDTAAVYGLGHSEEVVARALAELPPGRRPYVFTKCERVWDERGNIGKCLKADSVRRECEASLRRLGVETIELYQIHWPEPDQDIEEGWQTLAQLRAEGKVRWIGVSNFGARQMERARAIAPITSLQPPYSLVNRNVEAEVLPYAARHGIGVLAYSPMASGLLTGAMTAERIARLSADDWRRRNPNYHEPLLTRNLALVERLRAVAGRHGVTPGAVAVAWVLKNPAVTAAIVGARRPGQLREIHRAAGLKLSAEEIAELER
jgi:aryl-alcohol dehydrogenase-like predicted oxidoreductase